MTSKLSLPFLFLLFACGGSDVEGTTELRIGFMKHALECNKPGMKARLEATGVEGVCPLEVTDRTVSGVCRNVPAGDVRNFRLVYFAELGVDDVELATVVAMLDLRGEQRQTVVLDFPANRLVKDIDDDGDTKSNLLEFCAGTDPHMAD